MSSDHAQEDLVALHPKQPPEPTAYPTTYPTYPTYTPGYQLTGGPAAPTVSQVNNTEEKKEEEKAEEEYEPGSIPVEHLNLEFDACFHEHKSTKTWPPLHLVTGVMYKYTKLVVYNIFVILIGFIFAFIWAIINGITAFIHVWLWGPALKLTLLWIYAVTPLVTVPLRAICTPLIDVQARIFRQIRVQANLTGPFAEKFVGQNSGQQSSNL